METLPAPSPSRSWTEDSFQFLVNSLARKVCFLNLRLSLEFFDVYLVLIFRVSILVLKPIPGLVRRILMADCP